MMGKSGQGGGGDRVLQKEMHSSETDDYDTASLSLLSSLFSVKEGC